MRRDGTFFRSRGFEILNHEMQEGRISAAWSATGMCPFSYCWQVRGAVGTTGGYGASRCSWPGGSISEVFRKGIYLTGGDCGLSLAGKSVEGPHASFPLGQEVKHQTTRAFCAAGRRSAFCDDAGLRAAAVCTDG